MRGRFDSRGDSTLACGCVCECAWSLCGIGYEGRRNARLNDYSISNSFRCYERTWGPWGIREKVGTGYANWHQMPVGSEPSQFISACGPWRAFRGSVGCRTAMPPVFPARAPGGRRFDCTTIVLRIDCARAHSSTHSYSALRLSLSTCSTG